ncbi:MAG: hypothetical protein L0H84_15380 [Pseudonocardia sp.]|nr:hypothetical protein [Pseudonocardia sp.]
MIAAHLDVAVVNVDVQLNLRADPDAEALARQAREKAAESERLRAEALAANRAAARRLHADGWSFRLIGRWLGLSHQRAEQLVNGR